MRCTVLSCCCGQPGCIFHYDKDFPEGSGKGFKESDKPNFTGSYYSHTKVSLLLACWVEWGMASPHGRLALRCALSRVVTSSIVFKRWHLHHQNCMHDPLGTQQETLTTQHGHIASQGIQGVR